MWVDCPQSSGGGVDEGRDPFDRKSESGYLQPATDALIVLRVGWLRGNCHVGGLLSVKVEIPNGIHSCLD